MLTSSTPPPFSEKRFGLLHTILCVVAVFALLLLGVVGWYVSARLHDNSVVRQHEAQARQRGEPVTLEELAAAYASVPDAANAAQPLLELWKKQDSGRWTAWLEGQPALPQEKPMTYPEGLPYLGPKTKPPERGLPLDPKAKTVVQEYLKEQSNHLAAVRVALQRPRGRFPLRFKDASNLLLPHLSELKREAQTFRIEALLATDQGEADQSLASLEDVIRIGQLLKDEPLLISQLVRISCLSIAVGGMEALLWRQPLTVPQLDRLRELCEQAKVEGGLRWALLGERSLGLHFFESAGNGTGLGRGAGPDNQGGPETDNMAPALGLMKASGLLTTDRRLMWESFDAAIALAANQTPEGLKGVEDLDQSVQKQARTFPPKIITGMVFPRCSKTQLKFASFEARRRAALTALAVERFRVKRGELPPALATLVPEFLPAIPADPFVDHPLRYVRLAKGYVVYSVGIDRQDDGGKERPVGPAAKNFDETFTVAR